MSAAVAVSAAGLAAETEKLSAGPLGLLVVVLMVIATVLLIRSMSGRLRNLPREFPEDERPPGAGGTDDPGAPSRETTR